MKQHLLFGLYQQPQIILSLSVNVVCEPATGSPFKAGKSMVNCTATDLAQNSASCDFEVNVICTY